MAIGGYIGFAIGVLIASLWLPPQTIITGFVYGTFAYWFGVWVGTGV